MAKIKNFSVAGANTAAIIAAANLLPPLVKGSKQDRAYCEGRQAGRDSVSPANPHPNPSPGYSSYYQGYVHGVASNGNYAGSQFHTGILDR